MLARPKIGESGYPVHCLPNLARSTLFLVCVRARTRAHVCLRARAIALARLGRGLLCTHKTPKLCVRNTGLYALFP